MTETLDPLDVRSYRWRVKRQRRTRPHPKPATDLQISWATDIEAALVASGGTGTLTQIYNLAAAIRRAAGRSVPPEFKALIRCQLQRKPQFSPVAYGVWQLRRRPSFPR